MFKDIGDIDALAKGFENSQRMIGADKATILRLPTDAAAPEWDEFFTKLGRPEKPEGYEFPKLPGELIEGVEPAARAEFHKLGLSAKQAAGVMALYGGQVTASQAARDAKGAEIEAAVIRDLRAEFGAAFDTKLHAANRVIAEIGGAELGAMLQNTVMADGTRLGNHPLLIKAFAKAGEQLGEPSNLRGGSGTNGTSGRARTPVEAQSEIVRLQNSPDFLKEFSNQRHANYAEHKANWTRLHDEAYPAAS